VVSGLAVSVTGGDRLRTTVPTSFCSASAGKGRDAGGWENAYFELRFESVDHTDLY
jgi:hypothetical protein